MSERDQAALLFGFLVFLPTLIVGLNNRKLDWTHEFSRGLMRYRKVPKKPTTALHEFLSASAAGIIVGLVIKFW